MQIKKLLAQSHYLLNSPRTLNVDDSPTNLLDLRERFSKTRVPLDSQR